MARGTPRLKPDGKMNVVGVRLKARRLELGDTQDAVCARISMITDGGWIPDRRDLFKIESQIRLVTDAEVIAIAQALPCGIEWLLVGK